MVFENHTLLVIGVQASSKAVPDVVSQGQPFQVADSVIKAISIDMINRHTFLKSWYPCERYQAGYEPFFKNSVFPESNSAAGVLVVASALHDS